MRLSPRAASAAPTSERHPGVPALAHSLLFAAGLAVAACQRPTPLPRDVVGTFARPATVGVMTISFDTTENGRMVWRAPTGEVLPAFVRYAVGPDRARLTYMFDSAPDTATATLAGDTLRVVATDERVVGTYVRQRR